MMAVLSVGRTRNHSSLDMERLGVRVYFDVIESMVSLRMALMRMSVTDMMVGMMIVVMLGRVGCMHGYGYYLFV